VISVGSGQNSMSATCTLSASSSTSSAESTDVPAAAAAAGDNLASASASAAVGFTCALSDGLHVYVLYIAVVPIKMDPNITDHNLKTNYKVLIICGTNIPVTQLEIEQPSKS